MIRRASLVAVVAVLAVGGTALAARLPGVKTPTRNISCFYVPIKPTAHGTLLCDIRHATYLGSVQAACQARSGLDWHGFGLARNGRAALSCSGGVLYDIGRD